MTQSTLVHEGVFKLQQKLAIPRVLRGARAIVPGGAPMVPPVDPSLLCPAVLPQMPEPLCPLVPPLSLRALVPACWLPLVPDRCSPSGFD